MLCGPMRIYDAEIPNAIARQIVDELGGEFDCTASIGDRRNIFLHRGGVAICIWSAPRIYECHLLFPPTFRGRRAIDASREMGDYMMTHHADMLWGAPPSDNKAACWHIRQAGFVECGMGVNPLGMNVTYFVRRKENG